MHTVRRFLVTILVPAMIVSIFAVGSAAANGSSGKVNLCHLASQKFVKISVSLNAKPAHLKHGDVEPDEYGDCFGDHEGAQKGDDQGDQEDNAGNHDDSREGARAKSSHGQGSWSSSGKDLSGNQRSNGRGEKD